MYISIHVWKCKVSNCPKKFWIVVFIWCFCEDVHWMFWTLGQCLAVQHGKMVGFGRYQGHEVWHHFGHHCPPKKQKLRGPRWFDVHFGTNINDLKWSSPRWENDIHSHLKCCFENRHHSSQSEMPSIARFLPTKVQNRVGTSLEISWDLLVGLWFCWCYGFMFRTGELSLVQGQKNTNMLA